jgi:hypothetical protein
MALLLVIGLLLGAAALAAMGVWVIAVPLALIGAVAFVAGQMAKGSEGSPQVVGGSTPEPTGMPRSAPAPGTANERVEA